MAVSTKAKTTSVFDLKSAALTVLALLLKTPDLAVLSEALQGRFGETPGLFDREPVCIDLSALREVDVAIDFEALNTLLRGYGMNPMAARGGNPEQMAAALAAGLAEAPDTAPARDTAKAAALPAEAEAESAANATGVPAADAPLQGELALASPVEPAATSAAPPEAAAPAAAPAEPFAMERNPISSAPTLIIDKPLRSGQQVYARGADLIVLAVVSYGAEVIADGHIHVYAPLRGRALAGARGNTQARIFATCMEPQLVSIAGTYRTTEAGLPEGVAGQPAQVRLEGDKLIFEPLKL